MVLDHPRGLRSRSTLRRPPSSVMRWPTSVWPTSGTGRLRSFGPAPVGDAIRVRLWSRPSSRHGVGLARVSKAGVPCSACVGVVRRAVGGAAWEQRAAPSSAEPCSTALSYYELLRVCAGRLRSGWSATCGPSVHTGEVTGSIPVSPTTLIAAPSLSQHHGSLPDIGNEPFALCGVSSGAPEPRPRVPRSCPRRRSVGPDRPFPATAGVGRSGTTVRRVT